MFKSATRWHWKWKLLVGVSLAFILIAVLKWSRGELYSPRRVSDHSVIFYGEASHDLFKQCSRSAPENIDGYWPPTSTQVQQLEVDLPHFLSQQFLRSGDSVQPSVATYQNYYKQYGGFTRQGQQMIYLNAVDRPSENWFNQAESMCDGGESAYGLEYDVKSHRFSNFSFNGALF